MRVEGKEEVRMAEENPMVTKRVVAEVPGLDAIPVRHVV